MFLYSTPRIHGWVIKHTMTIRATAQDCLNIHTSISNMIIGGRTQVFIFCEFVYDSGKVSPPPQPRHKYALEFNRMYSTCKFIDIAGARATPTWKPIITQQESKMSFLGFLFLIIFLNVVPKPCVMYTLKYTIIKLITSNQI